MKVLVTGTSGFVGGAIADSLLKIGWEVIGVSRNPEANAKPFPQIRVDIGSGDAVEQFVKSAPLCSAIVHAAASLDTGLYAPEIALTNCLGTQNILRLANLWQVEEFVFISSIGVAGIPRERPITEEHPTTPGSAYHASKVFGEHLVAIASQKDGLKGAVLRISSPVGPGMPDNRILSVFIRRALNGDPLVLLGHGSRLQNYVDVRDVGLAVARCIQRKATGVFNIAGETALSNRELADLCVSLLDSMSSVTFSKDADPEEGLAWEISIEKAAREFEFRPRHKIEESISDMARYYASRSPQ